MYDKTDGPWHDAWAVRCEVLGQAVTIVSSADVASAIAELLGKHATPPVPAMVGCSPRTVTTPLAAPAVRRRPQQQKLDL